MRIFGKVCGFVAAGMLVLQAICVFYGYPLHGVAGGVELITLAVWCVTDGIVYFKKPKHPYLQFRFIHDGGGEDGFTVRADRNTTIRRNVYQPSARMLVEYFESEKNEANNG